MEMKIKVTVNNAERIMKNFASVQGKATARTVDSYSELERICDGVFKRVDITKKALNGTQFTYDFRQTFPSAYRYIPESTHFTCEYRNGNWYIIEAWRSKCPNNNSFYSYVLRLSDTAKEAVLQKYV